LTLIYEVLSSRLSTYLGASSPAEELLNLRP